MSRIATALALASLLAGMTAAPPDVPQSPQIRVSTRLVEISVIVRDKNGPVSNLTKDDFTVFDRGKPQQIGIFMADAAAAAQQPPQQSLPHNEFSDLPHYGATAPRSVTIVLLDNLNTLYGSSPESQYESTPFWVEDLALQNARSHLIEFIQKLDPRDRVAIYGLRDSLRVLCDFTSDRDQLLTILKHYDTRPITNAAVAEPSAQHPPVAEHAADGFENAGVLFHAGVVNGNREAETMAALQQIASHVANIPGRKNLVWLTANLPFSGAALARMLTPANIAVYPVDARGLLAMNFTKQAGIDGNADADEVSGAAGHYDNMPGQSEQPIGIATMKKLADDTGGEAFVNTNDITGAIRKAVEDSAVTYTLGFYINRDALDGKFHEIKVDVHEKDLTIRYPKGYFAYPDTAPTKNEDQLRLLSAVQSPLQSSVIPLQASLSRVNQPEPNSLSLSCSIDVHNLRLVQNGHLRKGAVIVYVIEQDQTGKVVYQWDKGYNLQITDAQYAALLKSGIPFHQYLHPKADVTTLRLLAEDPSTSQFGSLIIPLSQIN
ncbi:MAG TPA: VWA domain-containing protein [Candidatus Acidoferrales bacterium]|nr:VWA domain-containing protein [Candidatus Acidoferrales bacterium]